MPLFSPSDVADFQALVDDLAFHDTYVIRRAVTGERDAQNNRVQTDQTVEAGTCNLRTVQRDARERPVADALSYVAAYAIDLPHDTMATADDRIVINGRTFDVGGVMIRHGLATHATAICEERNV